jgi:hypothetical protein
VPHHNARQWRLTVTICSGLMDKPKQATAEATNDMGELRYVITFKRVQYLLSEVEDQHKDKRKWDFAFTEIRERREQYHHEDYAGRTKQGCGEEKHVKYARNQRCYEHHEE